MDILKIAVATFVLLNLAMCSKEVYLTQRYAFERIYYHNDVIWTPDGPSGHIQCANACTKSGADLCTAFIVRKNDSKCVFYGGWLDSPGTPIIGGLHVNRLVSFRRCTDYSYKCFIYYRHKMQRAAAAAKCSGLGGVLLSPTRSNLLSSFKSSLQKDFGDAFDYWVAAEKGPSGDYQWEDTSKVFIESIWADGEPATLPGEEEPCVYQAYEASLRVAPCSTNMSFSCANVLVGDF